MRVGLVYDRMEDYGLTIDNGYFDFSTIDEIENVKECLFEAGFSVIDIGNLDRFKKLVIEDKCKIDIIFNMTEGFKSRNREGLIPALCEAYNIKCVGTDDFGLSLTLHKFHTKVFLQNFGIKIPKHFLFNLKLNKLEDIGELMNLHKLKFPMIIKPNREGSSMGVHLVNLLDEAKELLIKVSKNYEQEILCEEYINGRELSVPIIGRFPKAEVMGIIEYMSSTNTPLGIFTAQKKKMDLLIPKYPELKVELEREIIHQSILAYYALELKDYARIDWIIEGDELFFLEATPLPAFGKNDCFEICANSKGYTFSDLLKKIINNAINC